MNENKRRFTFLLCGVVVFLVGYGTGRFSLLPLYENVPQSGGKSFNYTTSKTTSPNGNSNKQSFQSTAKPETKSGDPSCPVKGNMVSANEKKYYLAGDRGYAQVKPEQCFVTEEEAKKAGFVGVK